MATYALTRFTSPNAGLSVETQANNPSTTQANSEAIQNLDTNAANIGGGNAWSGSQTGLSMANPTVTGAAATTLGVLGIGSGNTLAVGDGATAHLMMDLDRAQTVTGTKTSVPLASPVVSGAAATAAGTLGWSGTRLLLGDGSAIRNLDIGTWVSFTPTLSQSASVTFTTELCEYAIIGKTAIVQIQLTATSAGTAANAIVIGSIPAAIAPKVTSNYAVVGSANIEVSNESTGVAVAVSSSTLKFFSSVNANNNFVGIAPAITLANGSKISCQLAYEIS